MAAHCSGCVFTVCVCALGWVKCRACHVTFSSTIHSKKKRFSFNPYKDIYYCQPLKVNTQFEHEHCTVLTST